MSQKRIILLFSALIVLIIAAFILRSIKLEDATARIERFPKSGSMFSSLSLELTDFEKDMLGEAKGYKLIYQWQGLQYFVTIIDGTANRQAVHDPRYCFRGSGWEITQDTTIDLAGGTARHIEIQQGEVQSEALFFYSDGERVFGSPLEYWMRTTVRRWLRNFAGAEPVLVMIQPVDPEVGLESAIKGLLPLLPLP